jgi:hypothetical protein
VKAFGGKGGLIIRPSQRYFGSNSNISDLSCVSLKELMKANYNPAHFNKKLIHIVSDPEIFILSYKIIKSKPDNSIPDIDRQTLDKIKMDWFINTNKDSKKI